MSAASRKTPIAARNHSVAAWRTNKPEIPVGQRGPLTPRWLVAQDDRHGACTTSRLLRLCTTAPKPPSCHPERSEGALLRGLWGGFDSHCSRKTVEGLEAGEKDCADRRGQPAVEGFEPRVVREASKNYVSRIDLSGDRGPSTRRSAPRSE